MKRKLFIAIFLMLGIGLVFVGCDTTTKQMEDTEEVVYSGPEASLLKFGDKATTVTPCQVGGTPLATFLLGSESVDVLNQYVQDGQIFLLTRWSHGDECRWVRLSPIVESGVIGYRAEILSGAQVLYGIEVTNESANLTWTKFEEFTNIDNLWVKVEDVSETEFEESFSFNNQEVTVISRDPDPLQYDVTDLINQATAGKGLTIEQLFGVDSSLYNSVEGERLVKLLELNSFGQWLYSQYNSGELELATKRWTVSDWAGACTGIKCTFGGMMANPVCATCTVVGGGLLFAKAVVCVVDCDSWPEWL